MEAQSLSVFLAIGGFTGWLTGILVKGSSFALIVDIIIGAVGALLSVFLLSYLEISSNGVISSLVIAAVGAVILLLIARTLKPA